jgi:hypothetical protein
VKQLYLNFWGGPWSLSSVPPDKLLMILGLTSSAVKENFASHPKGGQHATALSAALQSQKSSPNFRF